MDDSGTGNNHEREPGDYRAIGVDLRRWVHMTSNPALLEDEAWPDGGKPDAVILDPQED